MWKLKLKGEKKKTVLRESERQELKEKETI